MGAVTTGEPGSQVRVTNSGTPQNAVLDFTIPRGMDGTADTSLLALSNSGEQQPESGGALYYDTEAMRSGSDLDHVQTLGQVLVRRPGLYQVTAQGYLKALCGADWPVTELLRLEQDGAEVPGGRARQSLSTPLDGRGVALTAMVRVDQVPSALRLTADSGRTRISDLALTVTRLGDWNG